MFGAAGSMVNGPAGARAAAPIDGVVMSMASHPGTPFGRTEAPVEALSETNGKSSGTIAEQRPVEKLQFEREGYTYRVNEEITSQVKSIAHMIEKGNEVLIVGYSTIDNNEILENIFEVPISLRGMGISKAMYAYLNKSGFNSIDADYYPSSDNFKAFTSLYNPSKNNQ